MRDGYKLILITGVMVYLIFLHSCEAEANDIELATWLARSCIGEAGWDSYETGECAAILHVYRKRAALHEKSILWVALHYSAAIKPGKHRINPWVRQLGTPDKPSHWPAGVPWGKYPDRWARVYNYALEFIAGRVPDPLPTAMHFGCILDKRNALPSWRLIKTKFKNLFWEVPS